MRRIKILILLHFLSTSNSYTQTKLSDKLSFDFFNTSLQNCFEEVELRTRYKFVYNEQLINKEKSVTLKSNKVSISKALSKILSKTNLTYSIIGDQIIIKEREFDAKRDQKKLLGHISGFIKSENGGVKIAGAEIKLREGKVESDSNGYFKIKNISLGKHSIQITSYSFFDYKNDSIEATIDLNKEHVIKMKKNPSFLEEVIIKGNRDVDPDTINLIIENRKLSMILLDGADEKYIQKSGSISTPEALKRILGVSVSNDQYAAIRGMGDGGTVVLLNDIRMMPTSIDRNAFNVDAIPLNLLEEIKIEKSSLPNRPSDATGGIIILKTKEFPDSLTVGVSGLAGINDKIGFGNINLFDNSQIGLFRLSPDNQTKYFPSIPTESNQKAPLNQSYHLFFGNTIKLFGKPLGFLGNLNYFRQTEKTVGQSNIYGINESLVKSALMPNNFPDSISYDMAYMKNSLIQNQTLQNSKLNYGLMSALNYKLHPNHTLSLAYLYHRLAEINTIQSDGTYQIRVPTYLSALSQQYYIRNNTTDIQTVYFKGNHEFGDKEYTTKLVWNIGYNGSLNHEPNFQSTQLINNGINTSLNNIAYSRIFDANTFNYSFDFTFPLVSGDQLHKFYIGTSYFNNNNNYSQLNTSMPGWLSNGVYSNYHLKQIVSAYYGMVELQISKPTILSFGIRSELSSINSKNDTAHHNIQSNPTFDSSFTSSYNSGIQLMPSSMLLYKPKDNFFLRFAFNKTLSRPNPGDIIPGYVFNPYYHSFSVGNKKLSNSYAYNMDIRSEWVSKESDVVLIGVFYKNLVNNLEREYYYINGQNFVKTENSEDDGNVLGLEFEFRNKLGKFLNLLKHFTIGYNMIINASRVKINNKQYEKMLKVDNMASPFRPVFEQPNYSINLTLSYDNFYSKTNLNLLFNMTGEKLVGISNDGQPDIYELPAPYLDLNINQYLFKNFSFRLITKNLIDPFIQNVYAPLIHNTLFPSTDRFINHTSYHKGRQFFVGFNWNF